MDEHGTESYVQPMMLLINPLQFLSLLHCTGTGKDMERGFVSELASTEIKYL